MFRKPFIGKISLSNAKSLTKIPIIPPKVGYPIKLEKSITHHDLEHELVPIQYKSEGVKKVGYVPVYNPYVMKGATKTIREYNKEKEKELDQIANELSKTLEKRAKQEQELAMETFWDNERRGSDPSGNPTWVMRAPHQGPEKGKSQLP